MTKKKKSKKLVTALSECHISYPKQQNQVTVEKANTGSLVFLNNFDPDVLTKWPKPCLKTPDILLHKPIDFGKHARKLLSKEVRFYHPILGRDYTRISCPTYEDHKNIAQYFDMKNLPYHTFGNPSKRKMKVVVRGLKNINEDKLKAELKTSIPVVRVHKMVRHRAEKDKNALFLVVVPNNNSGRKLLLVKQIFGQNVKLEPINDKTKQCYRCQKWGHSQRYCHGKIKCVKCAGNHLSKQCDRNPEDPVKCANCDLEGHVASFRGCSHCPESEVYKCTHPPKSMHMRMPDHHPVLVTLATCSRLYKNVNYD